MTNPGGVEVEGGVFTYKSQLFLKDYLIYYSPHGKGTDPILGHDKLLIIIGTSWDSYQLSIISLCL